MLLMNTFMPVSFGKSDLFRLIQTIHTHNKLQWNTERLKVKDNPLKQALTLYSLDVTNMVFSFSFSS